MANSERVKLKVKLRENERRWSVGWECGRETERLCQKVKGRKCWFEVWKERKTKRGRDIIVYWR